MKYLVIASLICSGFVVSGCTSRRPISATVREEVVSYQPPAMEQGVVPYIWEEPMIDVVDVQPGLDPEGHYYRRAHQAVVEIRQGRWRPVDDGRGTCGTCK